ncbi:MAG: hypothetical protein HYV75_10980 [Opitutae bacterium]|nr:hypothetical protein [Opitutae bacterium]
MKTRRPLIAVILLLTAGCGRRETARSVGTGGWLQGDATAKFEVVARHLRGNDAVMWEVAHRHDELLAAIEDRNWPYAEYQLEKIGLVMQLGAERRPMRRKSFDWFFRTALPPMKQGLARQEVAVAKTAYLAFTKSCVNCHQMEQVAFIPVALPKP